MTKPRRKKNESTNTYNERVSKLYYSNGYNIKEISQRLNIDPVEVYNYVIDGVKITTEAEREEMISLFNKGYTYSAIARIFNKSRACVMDRIESPAKINFDHSSEFSDKQIKKMKQMADNGESITNIAKEIGVNPRSIEYRLSHMDVKIYRRYTYTTPTEIKKFITLYKNGMTHEEIAKECNRSKSTITRHLHKAGCYRRKKK